MTRTALYRHFGANNELLYVGVTSHMTARDKQHSYSSPWHHLVVRSETQWCETRAHALALERVAIQFELPEFNAVGKPKIVALDRPDIRVISDEVSSVSIEKICDAIGRARLVEQLSVSKSAVTNAIANDRFPARWVSVVRSECDSIGIQCPDELFGIIPVNEVTTAQQGAA